jgi:hypothetical protein
MDRPALEHLLLYAALCMVGSFVGAGVVWIIADWINRPPRDQ